ncbi:MAG: UTP--glucose-1-phosphate uridylyltransferase [Verrucomicrobia bacterium]|nr:UTP--glucose-1-phosphate uridylyltransferase [Verrucomicrobiota bacterium]MBS0645497.1 UTP--glucose-1-phosphate uridylyltransferase [Verrucomicrobiota bacterium]
MPDIKKELYELLAPIGQTHLLADAQQWEPEQLQSLKQELRHLDLHLLCHQQQIIRSPNPSAPFYPPLAEAAHCGSQQDFLLGQELMHQGKCGCVVLAGGQSSRLRLSGPKGCVPVSLVRHQSLFALLAEKVVSASAQVGYPLPLAIMTSTANRIEAETFFIKNKYFGLQPSQISFFSQRVWPLLSFSGDLLLSTPGRLAVGPNGNGDFFKQFVVNGIWKEWADQGVEIVRVMPIDNPLALPFDSELFGFHHRLSNDVSIQAIARLSKEEKAGTLVSMQEKVGVVEYGESPAPEKGFANIGLYAFSMPWVQTISQVEMPLHPAMKAIKTYQDAEVPKHPNVWKFEEFIFDAFCYAQKSEALVYDREHCFAPLKNVEGEDSLSQVQAAILAHERWLYEQRLGKAPPAEAVFELSSDFYYPTEEKLKKLKEASFVPGAFIS